MMSCPDHDWCTCERDAAAQVRGAFRALAEIGAAVAWGTLADRALYSATTLEIHRRYHEVTQLREALVACGVVQP